MTNKINELPDGRFTLEMDIPRCKDWSTDTWRPITQGEVDRLVAIEEAFHEIHNHYDRIVRRLSDQLNWSHKDAE